MQAGLIFIAGAFCGFVIATAIFMVWGLKVAKRQIVFQQQKRG